MFSRRLLLLILLLALNWFCFACQFSSATKGIPIKVTRVVSGQTVKGIIKDREYIIRLSGIDTPSVKQIPWGKDAQNFLDDRINNSNSSSISIETDINKKDKYDRISGYLWIEGKLINEQIIEEGYGVANLTYTDGKYDQQFLDAQIYARIMGKGIWNQDKPLREL